MIVTMMMITVMMIGLGRNRIELVHLSVRHLISRHHVFIQVGGIELEGWLLADLHLDARNIDYVDTARNTPGTCP